MGSVISKALILAAGYGFPAYECFKAVEKQPHSDAHQLTSWCHYWILVAAFTICESFIDALISWFPFYIALKLAFFLYIRYPNAQGTEHVYKNFVRPYVVMHEKEIDEYLEEMKGKAGDVAALCWHKAGLSCSHLKIMGTLQDLIASHAASLTQPDDQKRQFQESVETKEAAEEPGMKKNHTDDEQASHCFQSDDGNSTSIIPRKSLKHTMSPRHRIWKKILRHHS